MTSSFSGLRGIDQMVNCWDDPIMPVTREQLEWHFDKIRARVSDPSHGLFGPGSLVWRVNREQMIFLAGGRAALLQEAHPFVAFGVHEHSRTRSDPRGRLQRTFRNLYAMVFGDLESALVSARRVHAIHTQVQGLIPAQSGAYGAGTPYAANAEHALLWVHATLWESSMKVYELLFEPLTLAERERYYEETKLFAYLFGISDDVLPATWSDFVAYNERMWTSDELSVTDPARRMSRFLFSPPKPSLARVSRWYRLMTAGLLPPRVRDQYGMEYGMQERAVFEGSLRALRATVRVMPRKYRFIRAYQKARARIGHPIVPGAAERFVADHVIRSVLERAA
jgi:uncharacterized protein (DUF2236 family)